ncbi:hypothetical protein ElyMa_002900700 [Elysia marginata]|uniref:FLYWCH-type domain-containing protein n=1 Tax=Elysia marginata TaxID=1093978 RepID=A0AAV4I4K1_9GAST|nr:hypothetical protein ElyMa_002900700 [Elysia marginata]
MATGTNISKTLYVELTQSEYFAWTCSWCSPNLEPEQEAEDESPVQIVGTEEILSDAMEEEAEDERPVQIVGTEEILTDAMPSFIIPMKEEEPSLVDEPVQAVANVAAEFQIIPRATTRGCPLLVDAERYSYGIHRERSGVTHWRCTRRGKNFNCQAMVRQEGDKFMKGVQVHHHAADTGTAAKAKLVRNVKEEAVLNPFQAPNDGDGVGSKPTPY